MDQDRIDGFGHQFLGALKAGIGKIIGDAKLTSAGAAEQAAGKAQAATGTAKDAATGMDRDRIGGIGHQFRGAIKEGFGHVVGDPAIEADGVAERAAGKVQNAAGCAKDEARDAIGRAAASAEPESVVPMPPMHGTRTP
jgi:uncharacterized protein YjbJ (UPF0337 family)